MDPLDRMVKMDDRGERNMVRLSLKGEVSERSARDNLRRRKEHQIYDGPDVLIGSGHKGRSDVLGWSVLQAQSSSSVQEEHSLRPVVSDFVVPLARVTVEIP